MDHILSQFSQPLIYLIVFAVIFAETGVVGFFFLPGDTLLFTLGLFASQGRISIIFIILIVIIAGFLGNILGYYLGALVLKKRNSVSVLKKIPEKYIIRTHKFYEKYGSFTVVLSRFIPVVRTIAPFLAGVSEMAYKKYLALSLLGAILWGTIITMIGYKLAGYLNIAHIEYLGIILMVVASIVFPLIVFVAHRLSKKH